MQTKMMGLGIVLLWASAMSWLVWHDILPAWTAQEPPRVVAADWVEKYGKNAQFGVFNQQGRRIGGVWTRYHSGASTDREDDIYLTGFPLLGPSHINIDSTFDLQGRLDEIDINIRGFWDSIRIHGERFPTKFAFRIDAGPITRVFKIELSSVGTLSGAVLPFDAMPDLQVGQSWRLQVFNPIAAVTGRGDQFIQMLARVIGEEQILIDGESKDCFIVQTPSVKAWVERGSGLVLIQEVTLPIGGKFVVKYEPYDEEAHRRESERFTTRRKEAESTGTGTTSR